MPDINDSRLGELISRLIRKEDLSRHQAHDAFAGILNNHVTPMQQGAFLAALTAKGETRQEVAAAWEAIYVLDTTKVSLPESLQVVENCGTGMDTFKTFNISTAASIIAASGGVPMARHGARAITSVSGTVDMAEKMGVDVECSAELVAKSITECNIGLFNGMSPQIHPMALGRILSQIHFGSTLNIAASLANPAMPSIAVRGVYSRQMIQPVTKVMQEIGYQNAIVLHGTIDDSDKGMDEASICGLTHCAAFSTGEDIHEFKIDPKALGIQTGNHQALVPDPDPEKEAVRFAALVQGRETSERKDAAILNAGLIFLTSGKSTTLEEGMEMAARCLESGAAFKTLEKWVKTQNQVPEKGLEKLYQIAEQC